MKAKHKKNKQNVIININERNFYLINMVLIEAIFFRLH